VSRARRKTRTEAVDAALEQALHGENVEALLGALSAADRELFWQIVGELRRSGGDVSQDLWLIDYTRKPPSIREFVEDPYWLGDVLVPSEHSKGLFPVWKEKLLLDFDLESRIHNLVVTGSVGSGKCLGYNELCIMSDGRTKPVQDIAPGDELMGDDSMPRRVISTTKGRGNLYRIYPAKGESFVCNGAHILCLKSSLSDEIVEVSVEDFIRWPRQRRHSARLYRVPVEFSPREVTVDPYWLGLWLGDGTAIRTPITTASHARAHEYSFTVRRRGYKRDNPLRKLLQAYGFPMRGKKCEKFIPDDFLYNSREIRLQLLAGLLDTDGAKSNGGKKISGRCKQNNGCYEITVKWERFANQIRWLAGSLGYFAQTKIKIVNATAYFRTLISGAYDVPVKLAHKQSGSQGQTVSPITGHVRVADCSRVKFAVIPIGDGDYYGFEIDGNGRFLLKDFTVTHNTYITAVIFLYRIVLAALLRRPQQFFGLGKGSRIYFVLLSLTKAAVEDTIFGDAQNFMAQSPFFLEECAFDPDRKYADFRVNLGKKIFLTAGSKGWHVIGRNTMGVALDEGNWRLEAKPDEKAYEIYAEVRQRIKGRFQQFTGYLPAITILSSSARDESAFTEQVITEIDKAHDPTTQMVYRFASYEVKRHELRKGQRWFRVSYGLRAVEPSILVGWFDENGVPLPGEKVEEPIHGAQTKLVPEDFRDEFMRDPRLALQGICGVSTGGSHLLFSDWGSVERAVKVGEARGLADPSDVELIPISVEDQKEIWDYLNHDRFLTRRSGAVVPLRDPDVPRFGHIDFATQNVAGVAICHPVGRQEVKNIFDPERPGQLFTQWRVSVEYDFILAIVAGRTKPISFEKVQRFFFWLRSVCSYQFGLVSADQFQSVQCLEMLNSRGFKTKVVSTVRTKAPYYAFRSAFSDNRIVMYRHRLFMREAERLIDNPNQVVKPINGTKDIADACCGAYFDAATSDIAMGAVPAGVPPVMSQEQQQEAPPVEVMPPPPKRPVQAVYHV
jgi:Hom_end-associated Hint